MRLVVTNEIKNKGKKPIAATSPQEGHAGWCPGQAMDFWINFHPLLQRSGFETHHQLVVILSYFETDDIDG